MCCRRSLLAAAMLLCGWGGSGAEAAEFVYESPTEFFSTGDFNGDGVADVLVLDKATGNARAGYLDTNGVVAWATPVVTGVENATGCAVEHFLTPSRDSIAVTAPSFNQVNLVDLASANRIGTVTVAQPGFGPHSLAGLYSPLAPPALNAFAYLLVATSDNDPPAERLDLINTAGSPSFYAEFPETNVFERLNALNLNSNTSTFATGLVRNTNDTLQIWELSNSPPTVLAFSNLPPGSEYVFGNFNGETLPHFIFYQPGLSNLMLVPLLATNSNYSFGTPLTVTLDEPIVRVYFLPSAANGCALAQFSDGVQAVTLSNNAAGLSPKYQAGTGATGNSFTGAAAIGNGQFVLFDAPPGSSESVHAQVLNFGGAHFTQLSSTSLPPLTSATTRANVWLFQFEPFVNRSPYLVASLTSPVWVDGVSGLPGIVQAQTENDAGVTNGLGHPSTVILGLAPMGAAFGMGNQYNPAISIFSYSASKPASGVSVAISPPAGSYGSPLTISFSGTMGVFTRYRLGTGLWTPYSGSFAITNDVTIQYYGTNLFRARTPLLTAVYQLGHPDKGATPPGPVVTDPNNTNKPPALSTNTVFLSDIGTVFYGRRSANNVGTIWAIGLDGSGDTYVTMGARPRVSRDGHWLAFLRGGDPFNNKGDLWLRDLQTGAEQRLLPDVDFIRGYDWKTNDSELLIDYQCDISLLSTNGLLTPLIFVDCYDQAPTPDDMDGRIAFHNLNPSPALAGIYVANHDGTSRQRIISTVNGASWPAWSTDGQTLVFADQNNTNVNSGKNLWVAAPDGGNLTQISGLTAQGDGFPHGAVWAPDNSAVVGAGTIFSTNGLWVIPLTAERNECDGFPIRLPTTPGDPVDFAGSIVTRPEGAAIIGGQMPALFIRENAQAVVVYWNTNFQGFTLESRGSLGNGAWTPVAGPYLLNGMYFEHWEERADLAATRFFRLHYTGALVVSSQPKLSIEMQTNKAVLSWPVNLPGFVLQSKSSLSSATVWNDIPGPYLTNAARLEFHEPGNSTRIKFYRLRGQ